MLQTRCHAPQMLTLLATTTSIVKTHRRPSTSYSRHKYPPPPTPAELGIEREAAAARRYMRKFRFELLHDWIVRNVPKCRVADIGGGKGLLTYLLKKSGWDATVIDPYPQELPTKYKSIVEGHRVVLAASEKVPRITEQFRPSLAQGFDLLVGMHAHGSNIAVIQGAAEFGKSFILVPCCVIDEPETPPRGVHWLTWLGKVAVSCGFTVRWFQLSFKGQNMGFYCPSQGKTAREDTHIANGRGGPATHPLNGAADSCPVR